MRRFLAVGVLAAVSLSCGGSLQERAGDPRAEFARDSLALLLARDLDRLRERFSPELVRLAPPEAMARVLAEIPPGVPGEPMLVGVCAIRLNWTTGQVAWRPTRIQLLGTGFARAGLYAPWTLTAAVPVGAIVFWLVRRRLRAAVPPEVASAFE